MLSSTRIPNSVYNTLPAIESQPPPPENVLYDIGRLFIDHGVNKDVGIALLHKHFELDNEEVMVHDGLRCSPALPGATNGKLEGNAFFLQDNVFQAFEYEHEDAAPLNLSVGFLRDLREFLLHNKLQNHLALSKLNKEHPKLMEHGEGGKTHVCEVTEEEIMLGEATEWRFDGMCDFVLPVIVRGCARTASDDHKVK